MTRKKGTPPTNVAASVKARLLHRARRDGEELNSVLVRYVLERLLYRLANSAHASEFILKGALLFIIWSERPHRATKDLDLLGSGSPDPRRLEAVSREVCQVPVLDDGLAFLSETVTAEAIREEAVYDGIRLRFVAELGTAKVPVQVDVGFGDVTTPEPTMIELPVLLDHPAPRLRAYARESTIAEKLHALVELGLANSRMKDYYDLWFLSKFFGFDGKLLVAAVRATFERRRTELPAREPVGLSSEFATDPGKLTQWQAFLRRSRLTTEVPPFEQLVTAVRHFLMPILRASRASEVISMSWPAAGPWIT